MPPFVLKRSSLLAEKDFQEHPVWAEYYDPDEVSTLVELGYAESVVRSALEECGYSDDYAFPLPALAADKPFNYLLLSIRARTAGGALLTGYVTDACLSLFHAGRLYQLNAALESHAFEVERMLAGALGERTVLPIRYTVVATGEQKAFDFMERQGLEQ